MMTATEALAEALHTAIDELDTVGWDDAWSTDLRAGAVHAAIDAVLAARSVLTPSDLARAYQATTAGHGLSYPSALAWAGELIEALGKEPA